MSQMQVVVPAGVMPGNAFQVQTPDGVMLQTVVPAGVEPGQTIMITVEPAQPQMMRREELLPAEDAAAARDIAAGLEGSWQTRGYGCPKCFCPLVCLLPHTKIGSFVVGPLGANNTYPMQGGSDIWICPYLGLPCSIFHICPIAHITHEGEIDASGTTITQRIRSQAIGNAPSTATATCTLTSVDAKEKRATYSFSIGQKSLPGTRVVDGRAMTITDESSLGPFWTKTIHSKVGARGVIDVN